MALTQPKNVIVGTTATKLLDAQGSSRRIGFVIVNNSDTINVCYGPDDSVTTDKGIFIYPKGSWTGSGDGFWKGSLFAIVSSGQADVRVWEWDE